MNYAKIYTSIISRALTRVTPDEYTEKHHIQPRFLGGEDQSYNIVRLTAREHYIAHWLLYKIHRTRKSWFAWYCMCNLINNNRYNSHTFKYVREKWAEKIKYYNANREISDETRKKMSDSHKGKIPWNKGLKLGGKKSETQINYELKPKKCAFCLKVIPYNKKKNTYCNNECAHNDPNNPVKNVEIERKPNSGSFKAGQTIDQSTRNKISKSLLGKKKELGECPHCNKIGSISHLKRWHFDNCPKIKKRPMVVCNKCGKEGKDSKLFYKYHFDNCGTKRKQIKCPHCGLIGGIGGMYLYHMDKCRHKEYNDAN